MNYRSLVCVANFVVFALASACFGGGASRFSALPDHETLATRIRSGVASANVAIAELTRIETDMASATTRRDRAFFERLDAEEFLFTTEDGTIGAKPDFIAALGRSPEMHSYEIDDLAVKASGGEGLGIGIVWGLSAMTVASAGGELQHRQVRFTHVFRRTAGQWQLVAAHESPVRSP